MEKEAIHKYGGGSVGNYDIYLTLEEGMALDCILHSNLDDSISHAWLNNDTMPPSCKNLFENVDDFFLHFTCLLRKEKNDLLAVSDIGEVRIGQVMERKGKQVRVQCAFQCEKVPQHLFNKFYIKIIRQLKHQKSQAIKFEETNSEEKREPQIKQGKSQVQMKKEEGRVFLTVDMFKNPYINAFNKFHNLIQIQGYSKTRIKLFFNETIPKGFSFITIKIVNLKVNAFALGIIDEDQSRQIPKSPYSFCFEYHTGELKDTNKERGKAEARWRRGVGLGTADLKNSLVRMEVNTGDQSLRFFCNGRLVGQTVISNYLMGKRLTPYVSCKHQGDSFELNPT